MSLDAGIRRNQEGREARKTEKETEIKEGSRVRNRETETGTIPKVKLDLDPGKNEKEERRGLQEWSRIGLGRKRKAEEQEDMVLRKYKARSRKIKEGLDLQQKTERDNKVSPLISRFNFSSSSRVGQGEVRGGGGVVRDRAGHGDNSGSARDKRVLGEHPHSTTSTGPRIGRVGERKYLAENIVFEGRETDLKVHQCVLVQILRYVTVLQRVLPVSAPTNADRCCYKADRQTEFDGALNAVLVWEITNL